MSERVRSEAEVERLLAEMQESYLSSVDDIMRQNASLRGVASRIADQRASAAALLERAYEARPDLRDTFRGEPTLHDNNEFREKQHQLHLFFVYLIFILSPSLVHICIYSIERKGDGVHMMNDPCGYMDL